MREKLGLGIEDEMIERSAAATGELGRSFLRHENPAAYQLIDDLRSRKKDDLRLAALPFLLDSGFREPGERNEIADRRCLAAALGVEGTNELVHLVSADRLVGRLALGYGAAGLEAMVSREVDLTASLVDAEARLLVTEGDEEIGHQPAEEIAAAVVVPLEDADRGRFQHDAFVRYLHEG